MQPDRTKVIFCFPGKDFTAEFLDSIISMLLLPPPVGIRGAGISFCYNRRYSSDVYHCRNEIIRTHPETVVKSRTMPFDGFDYDYMIWIDSDQAWSGQDVLQLLSHEEDIVSAVVPLNETQGTCLGRYMVNDGRPQISYFTIRGVLEETRNEKGLIPVDFTGFGMICIKKGVMEKLGYPWFRTVIHDWDNQLFEIEDNIVPQETIDRMKEYGIKVATTEDIGWCSRVKKIGFEIYADPEVRIGHRKEIMLRADNYEYETSKAD